jgi:2-methylcitrate dehydratase PrpD
LKAAIDQLVRALEGVIVPVDSEAAREDARLVAADTVLCALLAGGRQAVGCLGPDGVRHWAGSPPGGTSAVASNAALAHSRELDAVHYVTRGHPGVVVVPALSALVDLGVLRSSETLDTMALATEVMAHLGQAWGPGIAAAGTHATSYLAPVAAVAAVERMRRRPAAAIEAGMFAAAVLGAGTTASFGTTLKPRQVGRAAALVVDLVTDPPPHPSPGSWRREMERRFGSPQEEWITEDAPSFASPFVVETVPSMFKLLPACAFFAHALEHMLAAVRACGGAEIIAVSLDVPHEAVDVNRGGRPRTADEVPFSLEYLLACLQVAEGLGDFRSPRWRSDPEVSSLVKNIEVRALPGRFDFVNTLLHGELRLETRSGPIVRPVVYEARPPRIDANQLYEKWHGIGWDVGAPYAEILELLLYDLTAPHDVGARGWFPTYYDSHVVSVR